MNDDAPLSEERRAYGIVLYDTGQAVTPWLKCKFILLHRRFNKLFMVRLTHHGQTSPRASHSFLSSITGGLWVALPPHYSTRSSRLNKQSANCTGDAAVRSRD